MAERQTTRTDESSYDAKYPYNKVWETLSGHQIQFDDTPGKERMFIRHSSGSYMEISADGKVVNYAVGDQKTYGKGGVTFTIDENNDLKISGHNRILMGGGAHIEVAGDAGVFAGGDVAAAVMGKMNIRASSGYLGTDGDLNVNVGGNANMKVAGDFAIEAGGTQSTQAAKITHN